MRLFAFYIALIKVINPIISIQSLINSRTDWALLPWHDNYLKLLKSAEKWPCVEHCSCVWMCWYIYIYICWLSIHTRAILFPVCFFKFHLKGPKRLWTRKWLFSPKRLLKNLPHSSRTWVVVVLGTVTSCFSQIDSPDQFWRDTIFLTNYVETFHFRCWWTQVHPF